MKFTTALVSIGVSATCFAQAPNSRFDGIWVGTETVTLQQSKWVPKSATRTTNTTIAIAQNGTLVGIIGGFCPGREHEPECGGNECRFGFHRELRW